MRRTGGVCVWFDILLLVKIYKLETVEGKEEVKFNLRKGSVAEKMEIDRMRSGSLKCSIHPLQRVNVVVTF